PPAGFMTGKQCQANSIERIEARDYIGERSAEFGGRSVRVTGKIHHPRLALRDDVIARPVTIRSGMAETRNGTVDGARTGFRNSVISESKLVQDSWPEVFDKHIGPFDQLPEDAAASLRFEVQSQTLLVPIHRKEIGADPTNKRWSPLAAFVPQ